MPQVHMQWNIFAREAKDEDLSVRCNSRRKKMNHRVKRQGIRIRVKSRHRANRMLRPKAPRTARMGAVSGCF